MALLIRCRYAVAWRTSLKLAIAVVLALSLLCAEAKATTEVTGERDTNAALTIDPSGDPLTVEVDLASYDTRVAFIQRMPATRIVSKVTLGDFGSATSCTTPASLRLFVEEHATGDIANSTQVAYSAAYQDLPQTPGRLTWTIPSTTFRAGRGYSFRLGWDPTKCRFARQTTWAHEQATVNGGRAPCTVGPPAQASRHAVLKRMWHVTGVNDRQLACASNGAGWAFDAYMPDGWLVTNGSYVVSATTWPSAPSPATACGQPAADAGARVVYWRPSPSMPGTHADYVCMWPQYEPLQTQPLDPNEPPTPSVEDGWYYGIPWKSDGTGTPRDTYAKLETIDYSAELLEHVPVYRLDSEETYQPLSPGGLAEFYDPEGAVYQGTSNTLNDALGPFAVANPEFSQPLNPNADFQQLTLEFLRPTYPPGDPDSTRRTGEAAESADVIDARGDADDGYYDDDARVQQSLPGYRDRVYGRAVHGCDGRLWLQYWVFYYDNPKTYLFTGRHEGDWEMVQLRLSSAGTVDRASFAQHGSPESRASSGVEFEGQRPRVYVAHESHASYYEPVSTVVDRADGGGLELYTPILEEIDNTYPNWRLWPGHWGGSADSPQGPGHGGNTDVWNDPSTWDGSAQGC